MTNAWRMTALLALLAGASARADNAPRVVNPSTPAPECTLHVNYDRNIDLPGYRSGSRCLPFSTTNQWRARPSTGRTST